MLRTGLAVAALALAACAPTTPDSNPDVRGVGFGDYDDYRTYRAAPPPRATSPEATSLAADALAATGTLPPPTVAGPTTVAGSPPPATGISDEQNFAAVSERETIESDAARLRRSTAAFVEVEPTAVPTRTGDSVNVVEYALSTSHPIGTKVYRRLNLGGQEKYARSCNAYRSAHDAQEAFLKAGGPQKDKLGMDPDGDGYACRWDPAVFRKVAGR